MSSPAPAPLQRIRFETVTSTVDEALPRMDIAAFVGFAAAGPLHLPVAVEDLKQYAQIFGDDPLLAWDAEAGEVVRGRLGTAVATFFANGGKRCWVVRVAGAGAVHNYFPLPGVLRVSADGQAAPALARARSPGSWSDALTLSSALRARALPGASYDRATARLSLIGSLATLQPGDLVRLHFGSAGVDRFWLHAGVQAQLATSTAGQRDYQLAMPVWLADAAQGVAKDWSAGVVLRGHSAHDDPAQASTQDFYAEIPAASEPADCSGRMRLLADGSVELAITADAACAKLIQPGAVLRVDLAGRSGWLVVQVRVAGVAESPPASGTAISVTGVAYWEVAANAGGFAPGTLLAAEALTIDLAVRDAQEREFKLQDVGLTDRHPRAWSGLHGDPLRYRPAPHTIPGMLDDEARASAFPLAAAVAKASSGAGAGTEAISEIYLPLGPAAGPGAASTVIAQPGDALKRDGLSTFSAALFIDQDLPADVGCADLMARADYLRYGAAWPRPLHGIHAVLGFDDARVGEEATLIAVPDALHRGWTRIPDQGGSVSAVTAPAAKAAADASFRACAQADLPAPAFLSPASGQVASSALHIAWSEVPGATYSVEESTTAGFTAPTALYQGPGRAVDVNRPAGGCYAYRVRAVVDGKASTWSDALLVVIAVQSNYVATAASAYDATLVLEVHTALLRMCAAQGELFAVLGLPRHFRADETRRHVAALSAELGKEGGPSPLSFGAVYHPWLQWWSSAGTVETMPPDGAALGVLAQRAAQRGAWVAPGNQPLAGVVAVTQALVLDDDVAVNIVRAEARGFLAARADTLAAEMSLINVRRLLILLRRLALRHGATYAFEANGSVLRRLVQSRFEALLRTLYDRGAFAGQSPKDAYRVDTGDDLNTAASMDQGRFIVALQVRPSRPMEFITIRLLQHGDQLNVAEAS